MGAGMRNQFITTVIASVAAWWIIQQLKGATSTSSATDLASAIGVDEASSETWV